MARAPKVGASRLNIKDTIRVGCRKLDWPKQTLGKTVIVEGFKKLADHRH